MFVLPRAGTFTSNVKVFASFFTCGWLSWMTSQSPPIGSYTSTTSSTSLWFRSSISYALSDVQPPSASQSVCLRSPTTSNDSPIFTRIFSSRGV